MRFHGLFLALTLAALGNAEDLALKIPPVSTSLDVKGTPVKITAWGSVARTPSGAYALTLTADLADLQANLTPLLAAQLDRSERCGERLSVQHAALDPAAPSAMLTANVHYERFACIKAFGKENAKRLVGGNAVVTVKLTPSCGRDGIAMASNVQKIDADGSLGELLRSGSLGDAIKQKIAASIESAVRKSLDLKSSLPPAVESVASIQDVRFAGSPQGALWISLGGEVRLTEAQFQSLAKEWQRLQ
jgi:hypothetical protein